jgi:hypothetical protein
MIKISREDVSKDDFQTFSDPFIKLDIAKFVDMIGLTPISPQVAMLNAINNPNYRFIVATMARRTGKTECASWIIFLTAMLPGSHITIVSPNYTLSELSWNKQRQLLRKFGIEIEKDNAKDRVIELSNGSRIRMGSVSQADSLVGVSNNLILYDEAAIEAAGREAFEIQLRPTLDKPGSKAIFISTPRGDNFFKDYYLRGYNPDFPNWCSILADVEENPRASAADILEASKSMSREVFRQEYYCDFTARQGQIYAVTEELYGSVGEYSDIIIGMDVGFKDDTAIVVVGVDFSTGMYYVLDSWTGNLKDTSKLASELRNLMEKYDADFIYVDSAAAQLRYDFAMLYDIATTKAKKDVLLGISYLQMLVEQKRLVIREGCSDVYNAMSAYSWDTREGTKEKPKHDWSSHLMDALRYAVYSYSSQVG